MSYQPAIDQLIRRGASLLPRVTSQVPFSRVSHRLRIEVNWRRRCMCIVQYLPSKFGVCDD